MFFRYSPTTLVLLCLLSGSSAGFWPFSINVDAKSNRPSGVKRVAIIGAGAAGSSAAYHLQNFSRDAGAEIEITVFEKSPYVGGRTRTVNIYDDPSQRVELGASIFVEINRILKDAAAEFNLAPRNGSAETDEPETLGIWDGEKFVFTQKSGGWAWWDITKLIWKYGWAPVRTQKLMKSITGKFLKLYDPPFFPFRSLSERVEFLDLVSATAMTGEELLKANNIGPPFTTDIIQASTRVNYGQNLGIIHGVETMVCMAIEGAMQIEGGNWRIFEGMLNTSKADVHLNTAVEGLSKENGKFTLKVSGSSDAVSSASDQFDTVILAAPLQFTGIKLSDGLVKHVPDNIPYVTLHVTLFATFLKFNESFFNLKPGSIVPNTILTTLSPDENSSNRSNVVGKSGFFSISTLRNTVNPKTHQGEYVYKIFSPTAITSTFLSSLFNTTLPANLSTVATTASDKISWYYPYVWNSYPYEYPRVTFEDIELTRGLYYTSGIESFISTMETSALMGKNVAQLIVDDYFNVMELPADETENLVEGPSWEEL